MSIYAEVIADLEQLGFDFRINDLDDSLEAKSPSGQWVNYDDIIEDIIKLEMRELGYGGKKKPGLAAMRESISKRAHKQRYNPIKDYLSNLQYTPNPNGIYKIPELAAYITNPDGYFATWLFRWMVGAVAKVFNGQRNPMLVLDGPQRIGKSVFAQWLCPLPDRFIRGEIKPDNKDHKLRLASNFIWEADELGSTTRRADADALKSFLTLNEITERPPFKKYPIKKPVAVSFIGTANFDGAGLLNDPTGTTRFLACEITEINFDYSKTLNVDHLWAEAYWFFKNVPYSWKLTGDEEKAQAAINANYEIVSALADVIENLFEITGNDVDFVATSEIKLAMYGHYRITNEQAFYNELSRVLTKFGLNKARERYANGGRRGWRGLRKKQKGEETQEIDNFPTAEERAKKIPF